MTTEGRDWTTTMRAACPDCGYDASTIAVDEFDEALDFEAEAWTWWLGSASDVALRVHTTQGVWSGLEYAGHVRDLFVVFAERVDKLREGEPDPLQWWDHEAAVIERRYNDETVPELVDSLTNAAMILGAATIGVDGDMWELAAERRPGERFTIADLLRFALHESFHHRLDSVDAVRRSETQDER